MKITGTLTRDFYLDTTRKNDLCLEVRDYPQSNLTVFQLDLLGETETLYLDTMTNLEYPEIMALYDFEQLQWVESELSDFWDGLQVCLQ